MKSAFNVITGQMIHIFVVLFLFYNIIVMGQKQLNTNIGNLKEYKLIPHGVLLTAHNAKLQLIAYKSDVVRIRMTKEAEFITDFSYSIIQQPVGEMMVKDNGNELVLTTSAIHIKIKKQPLRIELYNISMDSLCLDDDQYGISWIGDEITSYKKLFSDEKFFGLGEKTGPLNRRGNGYENWNSDVPAYTLNQDPLYSTIPFYIAAHSGHITYGILLDNSYRSIFNFGASCDNQFSSFTVTSGEMNYYFFAAQGVQQIISDYTWLTGHAKLPPLWSLGYQQCRWSYYPESEVMSLAKNFRDKKIPCDVIYLDINYMDNYKVFTFHPEHFPNPKEMVEELKKMGFHVVVIVDPGLKVEKGYFGYDEGIKNHYFVCYPSGEPYVAEVWPGRSHFPDFTNPKVRFWWGSMFNCYTQVGIEGFWNDMNEPSAWGQKIPDMVEFDFDGNPTNMKEAHNVFGMQMSRSTYEGARKNMGDKRPLVITRATYAGGQRYSTIWTGDNFASDDHMLLGVRIVNSLGISGFPFAGPDLGGFIGQTTRELMTRWLSIGVFTPFMRNHSDYGNYYREPWVFGKDWEEIQRELINQRYRLLPYIYSTFKQATENGIPVCRTLAINYTFDNLIYNNTYENEYLFGDNILVCPVTSHELISKVYLPQGNWYRFSTGQFYQGKNEILVESALNDLPVFVKAGALITMQNVTQYTLEQTDGILQIHLYKGDQGSSFNLYEDDGSTYNFEQGDYYKRNIQYNPASWEIVISAKEGKATSRFHQIKIIFHGFSKIYNLTYNKQKLSTEHLNSLYSAQILNEEDKIMIHWEE